MMTILHDYPTWREAITVRCGLALTAEYCAERLSALRDDALPTTRDFLQTYGEEYRAQVLSWFERAFSEADQRP